METLDNLSSCYPSAWVPYCYISRQQLVTLADEILECEHVGYRLRQLEYDLITHYSAAPTVSAREKTMGEVLAGFQMLAQLQTPLEAVAQMERQREIHCRIYHMHDGGLLTPYTFLLTRFLLVRCRTTWSCIDWNVFCAAAYLVSLYCMEDEENSLYSWAWTPYCGVSEQQLVALAWEMFECKCINYRLRRLECDLITHYAAMERQEDPAS